MANLVRSAKSGFNWKKDDLDAYNIHLTTQDTATFFGIPALPEPQVPVELLAIEEANDMTTDAHARLIHIIDTAMAPPAEAGLGSAVIDFVVELFKLVGPIGRRRYIRTRMSINLSICGKSKKSKIDVSIIDSLQDNIVFLVNEDRRFFKTRGASAHTEAQLIVKAIAAFVYNNKNRSSIGLPELQEEIIPGIVMIGTTPVFYKVPVTQDLVFNICHGLFPAQCTEVSVYHVPVARPERHEGMKPLDNRRTILSCYEAFKAIVGTDETDE